MRTNPEPHAVTSSRSRLVLAITFLACLLGPASTGAAQGVEITPFGGYRFGGDFFELLTRQRLDEDGAPSFGLIVDVPTYGGFQVEGFFTHQSAHVFVPQFPSGPPVRWRLSVDHYQAGGLQEFDDGRVRPFLTGTLGLTRYAAEGDNEIRFTLSAGGGVKLFPSEHIGVRLNSQMFITFADAEASVFACSSGGCFVGFNANLVWQIEFTAGLIVRFP